MRKRAEELVNSHVSSESLLRHLYAVEEAMGWYAVQLGKDEQKWRITGLIHDFDYERYPEEHPMKGVEILKETGFPEDVVRAVAGHASYTGVPRDTLMARTLFAVDELAGFVMAVALVRPSRLIADVKVKSVKKKLKDKAFARQVNREEILQGARELDMELDQHIHNVITALQQNPGRLGFEG